MRIIINSISYALGLSLVMGFFIFIVRLCDDGQQLLAGFILFGSVVLALFLMWFLRSCGVKDE